MGKTILIVEDEPKNMKLTRDLLKISGYETIEAVDGKQGVEKAKSAKPDLILMDIMMPKMDGYAACSEIKADQTTKHIPVVMLTAVSFDLNKKLAKQMGANGYITKPFNRQQLIDAITPLLATS
jgi:two-component system phosphate regulon response regulator PhoB